MNVAEMVKNVNAECHPITDIDAIIIRWLNRGQKIVSSKGPSGGWFWLAQYDYTVSTTSGTDTYALSPLVDISKLINFRDESSPRYIAPMPDQKFRRFEPGPTSTGEQYLYRPVGFSPVQNQPTSASTLSMTSSSATDDGATSVNVRVRGLNGSNILVQETLESDGTNAVVSVNSYTKILSLSKDTVSVGTFTITSNSGNVTNVSIAPSDRHTMHPVVKVYNIPDSTRTLTYDFIIKLPDLVVTDDTSMIPEQYHDVIELYAMSRCYKHLNNPNMFRDTFSEFNSRIQDMLNDNHMPQGIYTFDDYEPSSNFPEAQLPAYFPRD